MLLGIETSCDETSIAVLDKGCNVLSCVILSQDEIHKEWGGVFPELAARAHIERIRDVFDKAIYDARIKPKDISAIGVTCGPGLIGSLFVGLQFAKGLSLSLNVPFYGINHLDGHLSSSLIEHKDIPLPAIGLIVSGGHTELVYIKNWGIYEVLGRTLDDAVGEAYDKVARMLGLSFPGGPIIDKFAKNGRANIKFPLPKIKKEGFDFSFSGLKTAVLYYIRENKDYVVSDVCASFQESAINQLIIKIFSQASFKETKSIVVGGGVACNTRLREILEKEGNRKNIPVFIPSPRLCIDNGVMIAQVLARKIKAKEKSSSLFLSPVPNLHVFETML
ncbi:TPA: tRNA (adenosine(37)-N6)-threonylcarbamoyltransferase complex transferase subunit TsaD [bacterium]|nr:tRNA (adenosine(37)-N6)-threonylcarbamoyltransferase complex transferase subunit TsaD [bacterium]